MLAALLLLLLLLLLSAPAAAVESDKELLNIHRVEIRLADPDTQCDGPRPDWLAEMETGDGYAGLLEFGQMEETGFFSMAGYDFEYEAHAIAFTDMYSTACEPPSLVFFSEDEDVVDQVDPLNLPMTSIVKELAHRGIKARVHSDPKKQQRRQRRSDGGL